MRSVEWWHFQWPWLTHYPVFRVTAYLKSNISNAVVYGAPTIKINNNCSAYRTTSPGQCAGPVHGRTDARPLLKSLHWLPTHERIIYKVAVLTYKVRVSSTPSYLSDLLHPVTSSRSSRYVDSLWLQTQRTRTELGRRAFSVAAPTVWNSLSAQLRLSGFPTDF